MKTSNNRKDEVQPRPNTHQETRSICENSRKIIQELSIHKFMRIMSFYANKVEARSLSNHTIFAK